MSHSKPDIYFLLCKLAGFGLMFTLWLEEGETAGFFLLLLLTPLSLLRWRFPQLKATVVIDCIACLLFAAAWEYAHYALIFTLFEGMYRCFYWVAPLGALPFLLLGHFDLQLALLVALGVLCGAFLSGWEEEQRQKLTLRDTEASKYYELEYLQSDLLTTLPEVERMTAVAERARIAREIHDNAGHEIVAAYISLQTARALLATEDAETLELYDAALGRLNSGVNKIRETAHNLQTVTSVGVESLLETCQRFPGCPVTFSTHGDTSRIPVYVWNILEACLNESLTNVLRHAVASFVSVELDTTQHIVRLCVENDGAVRSKGQMGSGLRNLRQRAVAIGGSLAVDAGDVFRVICVIPIREENHETVDC